MPCLPPSLRRSLTASLLTALLATALSSAAQAAPPGVWREIEQGEGHTRTQSFREASDGRIASNFDAGSRVTLAFEIPEALTNARLYLRYNNAMREAGGVDVFHLPADGEPRRLGRLHKARSNRWDEFRWSSLPVGPVEAGTFRVRIERPADIASGGLDVLVLVDDIWGGLWEPPGEFRNGQPVGTGRTLPPVALDLAPTDSGATLTPGATMRYGLTVRNRTDAARGTTVRWSVADVDGAELAKGETKLDIPGGGEARREVAVAENVAKGWYSVRFTVDGTEERTMHFSVLPALAAADAPAKAASLHVLPPERWLGMNAGRGPIEEPIADFQAVGLRATRSGGNNANPLDHTDQIEALLAAGLEVHWVINYRGNGIDPRGTSVAELDRLDLNGPVMKAWFDNYKARCFAFFSAYSRPGAVRLRHYICGNEPDKRDNHTGLPGRPDVAALLTRAMFEAAREVNPAEIFVQSPPVAQPDSDYLRDMILKHNVYRHCDIIGTHVYGNQTLDHRLGKPWEWLAQAGVRVPVACTEAGVSVGWTPKGVDGREWQTDFMAHWYVKLRRFGYRHGILFTHDDDHHSDWAKLRAGGEILQPNWDYVKNVLVAPRAFRNGGFEEANDPRAVWVPDRNLDVPGWMERQIDWQAEDQVAEGRFAARFNVGGYEWPLAAYQLVQVGIEPGRTVTVHARLRSTGPAARISLNGYDPFDGAARVLSDPVTVPEWTAVSITVTPTNPWIVIGLLAEPGKAADDRVWFDDVRF